MGDLEVLEGLHAEWGGGGVDAAQGTAPCRPLQSEGRVHSCQDHLLGQPVLPTVPWPVENHLAKSNNITNLPAI